MTINKKALIFIAVILATGGAMGHFSWKEDAAPRFSPETATSTSAAEGVAPVAVVIPSAAIPPAPAVVAAPAPVVSSASAPAETNAALTVGGVSYPLAVGEGENVIDAMRALASTTSSFTFRGQDYPALGFFVDSINGKSNADGFYWILYVNGVSTTAGASSVVLRAGDTAEWRYKKGY